jgi:glucose-1-phosphate cytidylyltransferase
VWINGGFFVQNREFSNILKGDMERYTMGKETSLLLQMIVNFLPSNTRVLKPMDALGDRIELEQLWNSGNAKWKIW